MVVAYSAATKKLFNTTSGLRHLGLHWWLCRCIYNLLVQVCVFEQELHVARYWEDNIP